jgi:cytochrome c553
MHKGHATGRRSLRSLLNMNKLIAITAGLAWFAIGSANVLAAGDAGVGRTKAAVCASCHGQDGNSVNPEWPKLAGQGEAYIIKQLTDFKAGVRTNAIMNGMAAPLSPQDIADVAAYFSSQKRTPGGASKDLVAQGEKLYRGGNSVSGAPACLGCHGPSGAGNPAARFPSLSGQHATYVATQLKNFKDGARANDPNKMMRMVAAKLSDAEIKAVADYVQGLH